MKPAPLLTRMTSFGRRVLELEVQRLAHIVAAARAASACSTTNRNRMMGQDIGARSAARGLRC